MASLNSRLVLERNILLLPSRAHPRANLVTWNLLTSRGLCCLLYGLMKTGLQLKSLSLLTLNVIQAFLLWRRLHTHNLTDGTQLFHSPLNLGQSNFRFHSTLMSTHLKYCWGGHWCSTTPQFFSSCRVVGSHTFIRWDSCGSWTMSVIRATCEWKPLKSDTQFTASVHLPQSSGKALWRGTSGSLAEPPRPEGDTKPRE